jgi:hypothetical protein
MPKYSPSERVRKQIDAAFAYHPPHGDQVDRYSVIRGQARLLAITMSANCPESRELALALTHLESVVMFANAAIARNETPEDSR